MDLRCHLSMYQSLQTVWSGSQAYNSDLHMGSFSKCLVAVSCVTSNGTLAHMSAPLAMCRMLIAALAFITSLCTIATKMPCLHHATHCNHVCEWNYYQEGRAKEQWNLYCGAQVPMNEHSTFMCLFASHPVQFRAQF